MTTDRTKQPFWRSRWWMPAFCLSLGLLMLGAFAIGGSAQEGIGALAVMSALAAVFYFGRRNETIAGLGGPGRDERWESIDVRATAATGLVLIAAVLGAWLYEIAEGRDGEPFGLLASVAGITYLLAVGYLRWRG